MRSKILRFVFAILVVGGTPSAATAQEKVSRSDKFRLWNDCAEVWLLVEGLREKADEIGLTKDAIEISARSRLRGARIYRKDASHSYYLYVNVNVVGRAFSVNVEYGKRFYDAESGIFGRAVTWDTGSTGTYSSSNYILGSVGRHVDKFIDEYLRVNAEACEK